MSIVNVYRECRTFQTCYVVGENALRSLRQARNVNLAREIGLKVEFEQEQDLWIDYVGDVESNKTWQRRFEAGTHEVLFGFVKDDSGNVLASLGGIVVSCDQDGRDYLHAIELELLDEAMHSLKGGN